MVWKAWLQTIFVAFLHDTCGLEYSIWYLKFIVCCLQDSVVTCNTCHGSGMYIRINQIAPGMVQQIQTQCRDCGGNGERISGIYNHFDFLVTWQQYECNLIRSSWGLCCRNLPVLRETCWRLHWNYVPFEHWTVVPKLWVPTLSWNIYDHKGCRSPFAQNKTPDYLGYPFLWLNRGPFSPPLSL